MPQQPGMGDIKSLFLEDAFTFHVGPAKTVVKIPPSLLIKHSAPLNAMISNGMKETKKKIAVLPDEEPETVGYFLEWALTGVYRVDEINSDSDVEQQKFGNVSHFKCTQCKKSAATPTQINIGTWCSICKSSTYVKCSRCSRQATTRSAFETECTNANCSFKVRAGNWEEGERLKIRNRFTASCTADEHPVGLHKHSTIHTFIESSLIKVPVTGNLVAHAKVYVFAKKYLIKELAQMAVHLLHREFTGYAMDKVGSSGLVRMIEYAYQNSGDAAGSNNVNNLKVLALKHAALNSDKLLCCKGFCKLLRDGGEFGVDFARMLSKHVF